MTGCIPDDQPAKATIADEDVGAESEHETGDLPLASRENCIRQLIGGGCLVVKVRRSADLEGSIWSERLIESHALAANLRGERLKFLRTNG